MTAEQFEVLARLLRARGISRAACRLVLVDGARQCDAARVLNVSPVLVAVSLRHYRDAERDIVRAWGLRCGES